MHWTTLHCIALHCIRVHFVALSYRRCIHDSPTYILTCLRIYILASINSMHTIHAMSTVNSMHATQSIHRIIRIHYICMLRELLEFQTIHETHAGPHRDITCVHAHIHTFMCVKHVVFDLGEHVPNLLSRSARWPRHCSILCVISTKCPNGQDSAKDPG